MKQWLAAWLIVWSTTSARADDVLLFPDVVVGPGGSMASAAAMHTMVGTVLRDNAFVVLDTSVVERVAGDVLTACGVPPCVEQALMSLPARVALVLRVQRGDHGGTEVVADFFAKGSAASVGDLVLPVEPGKERKAALQIALYALNVVEDVGPSSLAVVDAARGLTEVTVDVVIIGSEVQQGVPVPPTPPEAPTALAAVPIEVTAEPNFIALPNRLLVGVREAFERQPDPEAWYRTTSPHAGRFLIQLRGGLRHSDVHRAAISLLALEGTDVTGAAWEEGPVRGVGGRVELFVGFAPASMIDLGVVVGLDVARDVVSLGVMREGEAPELGVPETFSVVRPAVQPRVRLFPVGLGPVKPYLVVGGELGFVAAWKFDVVDGQPYPRPPGGLRWSVVGGAGVALDPHPRVGLVLEAAFQYHVGALSRVRVNGTLVGDPPAPPVGSGYSVVPMGGVEVRL